MTTDEVTNVKITELDLPISFSVKCLGSCEARGLWGIKHTRDPVDTMVTYAKAKDLALPLLKLKVTKEGIYITKEDCINISRGVMEKDSSTQTEIEIVNPIFSKKTKNHKEFLHNLKNYWLGIKQNVKFEKDATDKKNNENIEESKQILDGSKQFVEESKQELRTDLKILQRHKEMDWSGRGGKFYGIDMISYGVQDLLYTRVFTMIVLEDPANSNKSPFMCHAFVCENRSVARKLTYALAAAFQIYSRSIKQVSSKEKESKKNQIEERPKKFSINLRIMENIPVDSEA